MLYSDARISVIGKFQIPQSHIIINLNKEDVL